MMNSVLKQTARFALLITVGSLSACASKESQQINHDVRAKNASGFESTVLSERIKDQNVIRLSKKMLGNENEPQLISVDFARGGGLAPIAWTVRLADGRIYNLSGAPDAAMIEKVFVEDSMNPYRENLFFKGGIVGPLFPLANRLTGKSKDGKILTATVMGQTVHMPLNNKAGTKTAIPHHLHGLIFGQTAEMKTDDIKLGTDSASITGSFNVGPEMWTGKTEVTTTSELLKNGYAFHLKAKNIGTTPVPAGAGMHPYFASPDVGADAIRVHVPARALVQINNLSDVLPTGKIVSMKRSDPALDFTNKDGAGLYLKSIKSNTTSSRLDNLWVDLEKDKDGFAYCEVFFPKSNFKVRMTALTKNIVGIQGYAPNYVEGTKPFVALELVTNLPDPREALWGKTPTGMKLLKPNEEFEYGYKVEVLAL